MTNIRAESLESRVLIIWSSFPGPFRRQTRRTLASRDRTQCRRPGQRLVARAITAASGIIPTFKPTNIDFLTRTASLDLPAPTTSRCRLRLRADTSLWRFRKARSRLPEPPRQPRGNREPKCGQRDGAECLLSALAEG